MILRPDGDGGAVVAIGQASHAWLSGQLARAWGNGRFAAPEPREEVCLGALQHDVGMAAWDLRPSRHPDTGLPVQFFELDRRTHLALWTAAPGRILSQSRYAALLVSLHGTGLYERFPPRTDDPEVARAVAGYLAGQHALQLALAAQLGAPAQELARNQALLAAWDDLSLALCRDEPGPHVVPQVPAGPDGGGDDRVSLTLKRGADGDFVLEPWPFAAAALTVRAEGRRLDGPAPDEEALHTALDRAPVLTVTMALRNHR
ncbi:MAG TPA: DUF3891 family protein [Baekduia sp.]|nr:DUF3891 family protein [Baekduia sp.]